MKELAEKATAFIYEYELLEFVLKTRQNERVIKTSADPLKRVTGATCRAGF